DTIEPRRPAAANGVRHVLGQRAGGHDFAIRRCQRRHLALAEPPQIGRPTGLRACARKPLTTEGLRADHRTDLVAVDVDVAGMDAVDDMLNPRLDARVEPEGQSVT